MVGVETAALLLGLGGSSSPAGAAARRDPNAVVPAGDLVAISLRGQVMVLSTAGQLLRRLPGRVGPDELTEAIQLAPDRRHAWVSVWNVGTATFRIFSLDLNTGTLRRLGDGASPTLSPRGTELAYIGISRIADGAPGESDLVIENLHTGRTRTIPFGLGTPFGTPPDLVINWSPDGQHIAILAGPRYRLVNVRAAVSVVSSPPLPAGWLAPAYLSDRTVVADANCCIGRQQLLTLDLRSGQEAKFARVSSPVQTVQRIGPGALLISDALSELVRVTQGRVRVLREGIEAVSS